jgi:hypothetical protein
MLSVISHLSTAFGLASASGLNAYIPLLIVALAARWTHWIQLSPPFDILANDWVIGALVVLLAIETVVDKIPAADSLNDLIQTFVRPAAGAILFAANANAIGDLNPVLALVCGLILAGGVHAVKATARPVVTAVSGGMANPVVSAAEDAVSATVTVTAILAPLLGVLLMLVFLALFILWRRRRRQPRAKGA